jgi:hypothetical protein
LIVIHAAVAAPCNVCNKISMVEGAPQSARCVWAAISMPMTDFRTSSKGKMRLLFAFGWLVCLDDGGWDCISAKIQRAHQVVPA